MIYFHNDYSEGCHPNVLEKLIKTNLEQTPGYGEDIYCEEAAAKSAAAIVAVILLIFSPSSLDIFHPW